MSAKEPVKTFVVVNPNSAGGATMKRWPRTFEKLEKAIGRFDYEFTKGRGEATLFAARAVKSNYQKIIAVGGDGTLNEVLQGLFEDGQLINPDILLGTFPSGTGADFARTPNLPHDANEMSVRLRGSQVRKMDIGLASFINHHGENEEKYFLNMADVGLGGEVVKRINNSPKILGGLGTYLFSSAVSVASYKPKKMKITLEGYEAEEEMMAVFVANGRFAGGGMKIAPEAVLDDGLFEIIVLGKLSVWEMIAAVPKLYSGKLKDFPSVHTFKAREIEISSEEKVLINLDGEHPGECPVKFRILPQLVKFII